MAHPRETSLEVASLLSNVQYLEGWRSEEAVPEASELVHAFLKKHASAAEAGAA